MFDGEPQTEDQFVNKQTGEPSKTCLDCRDWRGRHRLYIYVGDTGPIHLNVQKTLKVGSPPKFSNRSESERYTLWLQTIAREVTR